MAYPLPRGLRPSSVLCVALSLASFASACASSTVDDGKKNNNGSGASGGSGPTGGSSGASAGGSTSGGSESAGGSSGGSVAAGGGGTTGSGGTVQVGDYCPDYGDTGDLATVDYGTATAPAAAWANITGDFAGMASDCGQLNGVFPSPWKDLLIVGVNRQGLYSSTDGGDTFTKLGAQIKNAATYVLFDPIHPNVFWESGIYGWKDPWTEGVFYTTNDGTSFTSFLDLAITRSDCATVPPCGQSHNDSISVDFTDQCRATMVAGGHEQKDTLFMTNNGFQTFSDKVTFPAGLGFCTAALVIDSTTFVVGCGAAYNGGSAGTVRSTDAGTTWTKVSDSGGVGQYLWASDDSIYWRKDGGGMIRSTDHGATWADVAAAGVAGGTNPIELPDGRIVSSAGTAIKITTNQGGSWQTVGTTLPYEPGGVAYSPFRKAFYAWHSDCGGTVLTDAIMRSGWDYTTN
jgi:hypothetical protein